ncbi:hypothetical protein [Qaidamihabitans albus]|uniref:hypothetical protein n=1 Tax=Qaidamihabitans albus TaxID=2795733 RepID=UPI001F1AFDD2|nr:hypothetical protein [Qaidamihabitans albus]
MTEKKGKPEESGGTSVQDEATESKEKSGLRPVQVTAAGLAAVTAAFLGSSLGVYGTVLGAGLISVLSTVGSELYLRSLERTKTAALRTKELAMRVVPAEKVAARQVPGSHTFAYRQRPRARSTEVFQQAGGPWTSTEATRRLPGPGDEQPPGSEEPTVFLPKPDTETHQPGAERRSGIRGWSKRRWGVVAATSVLAFVIGMLIVTGIEQATGGTLSGGQGSTVGRLVGGGGQDSGGQQEQAPTDDEQQQPGQPAEDPEGTDTPTPTETQTETSTPTEAEQPTESEEPAPVEPAPGEEQGLPVEPAPAP